MNLLNLFVLAEWVQKAKLSYSMKKFLGPLKHITEILKDEPTN